MSQFPPPPPQYPQQGYPQPQYAQPGYAQPGFGAPVAPPRTNGAAIVSLILGVLGCVPFITGLLAIIFAMIGFRSARTPGTGGRGMAVAGLVLGIISVVAWGGIAGLGGMAYLETQPARGVAHQFIVDLAAGNLAGAQSASASGMAAADLQNVIDQMKPWGAVKDVTFANVELQSDVGQPTVVNMTGTAMFVSATKNLTMQLVKVGGVYKVQSFNFN